MATLIDSYGTENYSVNSYSLKTDIVEAGQTFRAPAEGALLESVRFYLFKVGAPTGNMQATLYGHAGTFGINGYSVGTGLAFSDVVSVTSLTGSFQLITFTFSGANRHKLLPGGEYVVTVRYADGDASNYVHYGVDFKAPVSHEGNFSGKYRDGQPFYHGGVDSVFYLYADLPFRVEPPSIASAESVSSPNVAPSLVPITPAGIASAESLGTPTLNLFVKPSSGIASEEAFGSVAVTQTPPPPPPASDWSALGKEDKKEYVYKVYTPTGEFVGVWPDVTDKPEFTQAINTPGTTMTAQLGRSPNNKIERRSYLLTESADRLTTESGDRLMATYETPHNVGPGTDVVEDYRVDVFVIYGEYSRLITEAGDYLTTESGEYLLASSGAPMGKRIFSGFILDYETEYGDKNGVTVTLASNGYELAHQLVQSGSNTTVSYNSELGTMMKSVLDSTPGRITYDSASIATTGVSTPMKFVVNTKKEAAESIYDQTPDGWYWFVDPADNLLYLRPKSATADHVFTLGKDIKSLKVKKSIEALVNEVYFIGGEVTPGTPSSTLFKRYTDPTSHSAHPGRGLKRITDRRFTVPAQAQRRAEKDIGRFKEPIFSSPLVISSARYDIESIKLGQTVGFRGFGNFLDDLPLLQIVRRKYLPTEVALELGDLLERQMDTIDDVQDQLQNEQFIDLPNAPS